VYEFERTQLNEERDRCLLLLTFCLFKETICESSSTIRNLLVGVKSFFAYSQRKKERKKGRKREEKVTRINGSII